ncbi:MAG: pilus assembly protein PilB [Desulfuromonadaceae bacterium]|nr:pilus assembly protein PilB [Desulfuromonadaceae bacterium]MDD2847671.1 pilus assembly protein PilB [Desulfuromonadaceae bacterium]MDD4131083.1 pilus assembly protein PilB [Desulfuromonadaceae bacterium]
MSEQKKGSMGAILSACNIINEGDITAALEEQARSGVRFGEALITLGIVTQEDIDWALSNQLDLPYIRLKADMIDPEAIRLVPAATARKFNLIPLIKAGGELNIAISDPLNKAAIAAVEQISGCEVNVSVALIREIREMIDACYGCSEQQQLGFASNSFSDKALEAINSDLSGGKLLDYLLIFMLQNRLSSLSLQPMGEIVVVSGRRSGVSHPVGSLDGTYYPDITRRIRKGCSNAAGTRPDSGGLLTFSYRSHPVTFEVASMAGFGGEYITIRPHLSAGVPKQLAALHLPAEQEAEFIRLSRRQQGITFFASRNTVERDRFIDLMLEEIDTAGKNVIILGNGPGETSTCFPRVILPRDERERAAAIMSVLDHAPDILVIEDATEGLPFTAACRAAMRGKLVLAGLEIRGTRNVLRQLLLYQQQSYFLPIFVNGLISFKGIQLLCPECRTAYTPPAEELAAMNLTERPAEFFRTTGCHACGHSGFSARKFLVDILTFNDDFLRVFEQSSDVTSLENHLGTVGYQGLSHEGLKLLMAGDVSPEEYISAVVL